MGKDKAIENIEEYSTREPEKTRLGHFIFLSGALLIISIVVFTVTQQ